ncbi:outer membrane beta-barrel protein [Halomonas nitroreducens]|uniref:Porin family protein n=1 Tax=Halomonas nitroreducens TaxID=447425 RepID=A0A3S0KNH5_9GAMM|nr:outer membrane beta-barrel protein [Halomonas nitroreducens]RTQ99157.1 porin family protein [Halomonas nitroreducens]
MLRTTPLTLLLAAGLALAAGNAQATGDTGPYLGGGIGQMHGDGDFDDQAEHWKLVGGYNVGWLPFLDLGAELAYVNGGTLDGEVGGRSATLEVESVQAMGVAGLSVGPLGVYAKAGMADWDADQRGRGVSRDRSGTDPVYGLGARVGLLGLTGRLEVERLDTDEIGNLDMFTAGVVYTF